MATFDLKTYDERKILLDESSIAEAEVILSPCEFPEGKTILSSQVAGHPYNKKKKSIGMLRGPNGRVFKPIEKPHLGVRETNFYKNLKTSLHPTDIELLRLTPTYYGLSEMRVFSRMFRTKDDKKTKFENGQGLRRGGHSTIQIAKAAELKFLELEDITEGMAEPCVMDIKIGKRTWDPTAGPEKRAAEETKYAASKEAYGFSIAGFQVYQLPGDNVRRCGKEFGKNLDPEGVAEAIEQFLNGVPGNRPQRDLVMRLLSMMWKILSFIRIQRKYRFYSSSLLIAYDAKRLRQSIRAGSVDANRQTNSSNASSGASPNTGCTTQVDQPSPSPRTSPVKGQSPEGSKQESPSRFQKSRTLECLQRLTRNMNLTNNSEAPEEPSSPSEEKESSKPPVIEVQKLCRTHSYSNNFDDDMIEIKEDYENILSELSGTGEKKPSWVRVFMIDFTHVFPAEDDNIDLNYMNGIENLIKLLEGFLT